MWIINLMRKSRVNIYYDMKQIKRALAGLLVLAMTIPQITFSQSSGETLYLNEFDGAAPAISYAYGEDSPWYDTTFGSISAQGGILSLSGITGTDTSVFFTIPGSGDVFPGEVSPLGLIVSARVRIVSDLPDVGLTLFTDNWQGDSAFTSVTNEWVTLEFNETIDFTDFGFELSSYDGSFSPSDTIEIDWVKVSSPALVPGVYFNAASDNDWSNVSNWWADAEFTVPANVLPGSESDVVISGLVSSDSSGAATVNSAVFTDGSELVDITLTAATTTFEGSAINRGTVEGNAIFTSAEAGTLTLGDGMYWGTVNGSVFGSDDAPITSFIFNASSVNVGTVPGNATFNAGAQNDGTVQGDAQVNYPFVLPLGGTVEGNVTYSGYTTYYYNNAASDGDWANLANWWLDSGHTTNPSDLPGNESDVYIQASVSSSGVGPVEVATATFSSGVTWGSGLSLTVSDGAVFNAALNSGSVTGSTTFSGSTARNNLAGSVTGNVTFDDGSRNYGSITGPVVFNGGSRHEFGALITGNAVFNDSLTQSGSTIAGEAVFNNSNNSATVGSSTFNGSSANLGGTVSGAVFNDSSYNQRTISGNAVFNDSSYNSGASIYVVVTGNATFNGNSYNSGTVQGNAEFNDSSSNVLPANPSLGLVAGDAVFRDSSSNTGTIQGNADVYFPVTMPLGGSVGGALTYYDYPEGVYFNNAAADGDWANIANWWADAGFTQQAGSVPGANADVFVSAPVTQNTGDPVSVNSIQFSSGAYNEIEVTVADGVVFTGGSYNNGTVNGAAIFEDGSYNSNTEGATVNGSAIFQGSAYNQGVITGDAIYASSTGGTLTVLSGGAWSGSVGGTVRGGDGNPITDFVFEDGSYNSSGVTVPGNATFSGSAYNSGTVSGNATFNGSAYNAGAVLGDATYSSASGGTLTISSGLSWTGSVGGTIRGGDSDPITDFVFEDGSYNSYGVTVPGNATFNGSAYNSGTTTGDAVFNDSSYNSGTVQGNAIFNGSSYNSNFFTVDGNATFNDSSHNSGTVMGDAVFNDSSYNEGLVEGDATYSWVTGTSITIESGNAWTRTVAGTLRNVNGDPVTLFIFEDGSYNDGVVSGDAVFNGTAYNNGIVTGDATYASTTGGVMTVTGSWNGNVLGTVRGGDNNPISDFVFEDGSYNFGTARGNATFNGNSYNRGTTTGDAIFNDTSYNYYGHVVMGDATFNDDSFNRGAILGDATYSSASGGVITINSGISWMGSVAGTIRGGDGNPITDFVFEDGSYNAGTVSGDATFNDGSYSQEGAVVTGSATFNGSAYNSGTVRGDAVYASSTEGVMRFVSDDVYLQGVVQGTIRGGDGVAITDFVFEDNSLNAGNIVGNTTFGGNSSNLGTTTGSTVFNESSSNDNGGVVSGDISFNGEASNRGRLIGDAVFNATSTNHGTIVGNPVFNDSSYASAGVIQGNATFNDSSHNAGDSTVTGDAVFNDQAFKQGTVSGNATFYDDSLHQHGTIAGNAVFNGRSSNIATVSGDATFNDDSRNGSGGTVTGDATFNNASIAATGSFGDRVIRRFTIATSTALNFLTDGGRNDWVIIADGIVLDLSEATYNGSNVFQARNGGSFVPELNPILVIAQPNSSIVTSWSPLISWGNASVCEYSFSGENAYDEVDCSLAGSDIPAPADGLRTLLVRATGVEGNINEKSFSFRYSPPTAPVFASSNPTVQMGTSLSRKVANIRSQSATIVSSAVGVSLAGPGSVVSFTKSVLERLINVLRGPSAVPVSIGITPAGIVTSFSPAVFPPGERLLSSCPDMVTGSVGPCVQSLQKFLNSSGFTLVEAGPGSSENETTYFGPATQAALVRFQKDKGISPATGHFGSKTKAFISTLGL